MDFSEFETTSHGTWQMAAVVDCAAKLCLSCQTSGTQRAEDAVRALEAAIDQAESLLGHSLLEECLDPATGAVAHLTIVSDNGPAFKSAAFARFIMARPYLKRVRTRFRSPETNGVVERFFESVKYEHLYTLEISNGHELGQELERFRALFNRTRPHEGLGFKTPLECYLGDLGHNLLEARTVQKS
jgi:transposase InsO family protein